MLVRAPAVAVSVAELEEALGFLSPLNLLTVAQASWPPFCTAQASDSGGCLILVMAVVLSLPNDGVLPVKLFAQWHWSYPSRTGASRLLTLLSTCTFIYCVC